MRGILTVGLALVALASVGAVAADEGPMAEAGLDQDAEVNTTVYLDAGGSLDPDSEVRHHEWSIETPNGSTVVPNCGNCVQTWFVPRQLGRYNVTVQVTDDGGEAREDTLFVFVGGIPSGSNGPTNTGPSGSSGGSGVGSIQSPSGTGGSGGTVDDGSGNVLLTEENGELMIVTGQVQPWDTVRVPVEGGQDVTIPGDEYIAEQEGPGRAPATEFARSLSESDVTPEDGLNSLTDNSVNGNNPVGWRFETSLLDDRLERINDGVSSAGEPSTDDSSSDSTSTTPSDTCPACDRNSIGESTNSGPANVVRDVESTVSSISNTVSDVATDTVTGTVTDTVSAATPDPVSNLVSSAVSAAASSSETDEDSGSTDSGFGPLFP